jgi:cyclopropane fatty-acyl-phospholipid synthase-like methyltransferase
MKTLYGHDFYQSRHQQTQYSAKTILTLVLAALPKTNSAVDFGCGVGTWLAMLHENGVEEIQGFDGPWVEHNLLEIPEQNFRQANLEEKINLDKKYDLAISLEVAEHLHPDKAKVFIETLANAADFVLFSAAIPFQGGKGHINEQWPDYWSELFNGHAYDAVDLIRQQIWHENEIPLWYRQNLLLYVKRERKPELKFSPN